MSDISFLIVDDDSVNTHLLRKILECKYKTNDIDIFKNPENALREAEQRDYSLVISDICMVPINGFVFYQRVKKIKDMPVVLMTGSADDIDFKKIAAELGVEIIPKPLDCKVVIDTISKYIPLPESS